MLAEAKLAGVAAIFLSDHHRPPRDFFLDSWRGPRDGVLFVPGSEARGFLLCPTKSVLDKMEGPPSALLEAVRLDGGLAFLSHVEERPDHDMADLDGMEIYNRHADARKDFAGLASLGRIDRNRLSLSMADRVVFPLVEIGPRLPTPVEPRP